MSARLDTSSTTVDSNARRAFVGVRELSLTATEFLILESLASHAGWVVTRAQLADRIWGGAETGRALGVHVANLRGKLRRAVAAETVECVREVGYRLVPALPSSAFGLTPTSPRLVGRDSVLALAETWLDSVLDGAGRSLVLLGRIGYGKSQLALATARMAQCRGMTPLWGRCESRPERPALWPVVELIMSGLGPTPLERLQGYPLVAQFVADAAGGVPHGQVTPPAALYQELFALACAEAAEDGLLLVLEDIHEADSSTLNALRFGLPRMIGTRVGLLMTCSSDVPASSRVLQDVLGNVTASTDILTLQPLSRSETGELIASISGRVPAERTAARVHRLARGNPAMARQICLALESGGRLADLEGHPGQAMAEAFACRVAQLPAPTSEVLRAAARLSIPFDDVTVARATGQPLDAARGALSSAVGLGYLVAEPESRYRFAHPALRASLRDGRSPQGPKTVEAHSHE